MIQTFHVGAVSETPEICVECEWLKGQRLMEEWAPIGKEKLKGQLGAKKTL